MRVNLGCGVLKLPDWYNVDIWEGVKPDCVADVIDLALPDCSVDTVYMGHILEHLHYPDAVKCVRNVERMLKPGGLVIAVGPDVGKVDQIADPLLWEALRYGGHPTRTDPYTRHRWECTQAKLEQLLRTAFPEVYPMGLEQVAQTFREVSRVSWQCAVMANKPSW